MPPKPAGTYLFNDLPLMHKQGPRVFSVNALDDMYHGEVGMTKNTVDAPVGSFNNLPDYTEILTEDGSLFVTTHLTKEYIPVSEYFSETIVTAFTFTFYDSEFNLIGTIHDKVTYDPSKGESDTAGLAGGDHCLISTIVTKHFFNDDDNYEVMVSLGKKAPGNDYHPNFYEQVYSLGGEKDAEGNDKCLYTFNGLLADCVYGEGDDCYLTFVREEYFTAAQYPDPVERANHTVNHITVYGKAVDGEPVEVYKKDILLVTYPNDTADGTIYLISKNVNGTPYFYFSHYELPYFVNPLGGATDESATENNNFIIETKAIVDGEMKDICQTSIPVVIPKDDDHLYYSFYSIGGLTWRDDIDTTVNGTPEAPAFIVMNSICQAANLEAVLSSYNIYKADGTVLRPLTSNAENFVVLNRAGSDQPHVMFIRVPQEGQYQFDFVDLYSGETTFSCPQVFNGEPLTASVDRIRTADGSYKYGFVMSYDDIDDDNNIIKRVKWLNTDGTEDRVDRINMGPEVQMSLLNFYGDILSPRIFDEDDEMEYAVLVKRTYGATVRNEFMIVDHNGEWYAHFSSDDRRGEPNLLTVYPGANGEGGRLYMAYIGNAGFNIDVYALPFTNTLSVDSIEADDSEEAGEAVYYNLQGVRVNNPSAGSVYIRVLGDKATKVLVQ